MEINISFDCEFFAFEIEASAALEMVRKWSRGVRTKSDAALESERKVNDV